MALRAPFRFAPVARKVWFPGWAEHVSHDVPFTDGFCGEITFDIEAESDLLVGGPRRKATPQQGQQPAEAAQVWPVQLPGGRYALPSSSLQGMVRTILEVASFGKLGPVVADQRFGIRDISGSATGKAAYGQHISDGNGQHNADPIIAKTKTGWLRLSRKGVELVPCNMARIDFADIATLGGTPPLATTLGARSEAQVRYRAFLNTISPNALSVKITLTGPPLDERHTQVWIRYQRCRAGGATDATLVFTGKPSPGVGAGAKKLEFAFFGPDRATAVTTATAEAVPDAVWKDFLLIHAPEKGSGKKTNPNWEYWRPYFEAGEPVPVFWLEGATANTIKAIGTAYMFKLAMAKSTHDLLKNSSADHLCDKDDLPTLIFGKAGSEDGGGLKRRAAFDWAIAQPASNPVQRAPVVLLSPKPNYYPLYVRQSNPVGATYAVYDDQPGKPPPELAGVKLFPVTSNALNIDANLRAHRPQIPNSVGAQLRQIHHVLPSGTRFERISLRCHNMRPVELGALLWALSFGHGDAPNNPYRHRLGMGKPLGMGVIRIGNLGLHLLPNDPAAKGAPDIATLINCFTDAMQAFHGKKGWVNSPQILALKRAARPDQNADNEFGYMNGYTEYANRRNGMQALSEFVDLTGELPGPAVAVVYLAEEDAPVRLADGITGRILQQTGERFEIMRADGRTDWLFRNQFEVTGTPDC